jgi:hypothetical protein
MSERDIADSDSNVTHPVNEGTLGVEQVELVVETRPGGGDADISQSQSKISLLFDRPIAQA